MDLDLTQIDATLRAGTRDGPLDRAITTRLSDLDSGKYRRNTKIVLQQCTEYLRRHAHVEMTEISDIDAQGLRLYARALRRAVEREDLAASTAEQYWAIVSAFLGWCVREGLLDSNPALLNEAKEPLPESDGDSSPQFWSERERKAICATVDQHVDEVLATDWAEQERLLAYRDRALVYTLAYSGCRGAELAAVPDDKKRDGVTWVDLNLEDGIIEIYGKDRTKQTAPILDPAIGPLQRWQDVLDPDEEWPIFPSGHLPTLYALLPDGVESDHERIWRQLQESEATSPSTSTRSVRRILERLCEQSDYEFDEVLQPHGARRGLGNELYQEDAVLAQETLRHKNIETTHESYRDEQTRQLKERADDIIE